ncbi:MAG TPA: hypothetical protein VMV69_29200 [Pirellulales bacterium]|nr:hypothetical protein [Pirellulales bacterium]
MPSRRVGQAAKARQDDQEEQDGKWAGVHAAGNATMLLGSWPESNQPAFGHIEWLDKELLSDALQGESRFVDVVAKLPTLQAVPGPDGRSAESWLALVHEVEAAKKVAPLRRRMFEYYEPLRRRHDLPVLPIGLYLRVGLDGIGWDAYEEYFWEHQLVRFNYPYVGLPALDGE